MKIIAWNCNMAFGEKLNTSSGTTLDLLIIPECENPDKLKFSNEIKIPTGTVWIGNNIHKGLGSIFL